MAKVPSSLNPQNIMQIESQYQDKTDWMLVYKDTLMNCK